MARNIFSCGENYRTSAHAQASGAYIMWAGSPYAHLQMMAP
jgi:hypothetical protein